MPQSLLRFIIVSITSVCCSMAAIWVFGLSMDEKSMLLAKLETIRKKYK